MGFHSQDNLKYGDASIKKALASGQITPDDADLIRAYAAQYQAERHVSNLRVLKSIFEVVTWRRFIRSSYRYVNHRRIHSALNELNTANNTRGTPYKQNTKHDYVKALKWFLQWMISEGHSKIAIDKIDKIKVPSVDSCTTTPDGLLQEDDILAMVTQARTSGIRPSSLSCMNPAAASVNWPASNGKISSSTMTALSASRSPIQKPGNFVTPCSAHPLNTSQGGGTIPPALPTMKNLFSYPRTANPWNTGHCRRLSAGPRRKQA